MISKIRRYFAIYIEGTAKRIAEALMRKYEKDKKERTK